MTSETKSLVVEMSAGIVIWNLFLAFAGCVFAPLMGWSRISMLLGVVIGMAAAVVMLIHMAVITEKVLDSADQSYANKTTVIHSMIRKFVYIILLILLYGNSRRLIHWQLFWEVWALRQGHIFSLLHRAINHAVKK